MPFVSCSPEAVRTGDNIFFVSSRVASSRVASRRVVRYTTYSLVCVCAEPTSTGLQSMLSHFHDYLLRLATTSEEPQVDKGITMC